MGREHGVVRGKGEVSRGMASSKKDLVGVRVRRVGRGGQRYGHASWCKQNIAGRAHADLESRNLHR